MRGWVGGGECGSWLVVYISRPLRLGCVWQTTGNQCAEDTYTRNGASYKEHRRMVMVRWWLIAYGPCPGDSTQAAA